MCEYCEKSKNIYTKDRRGVVYVEWDDCKPKLVTVNGVFDSRTMKVPIFFCPFCGKELRELDQSGYYTALFYMENCVEIMEDRNCRLYSCLLAVLYNQRMGTEERMQHEGRVQAQDHEQQLW